MTSSAPVSIASLPRGHSFAPAHYTVEQSVVSAYLHAVGDENEYNHCVPPLAAVALGLTALQQQISLPEGSLHTRQEVEHLRSLRPGEALTLSGSVVQRSERQGFVISVLEFEIASGSNIALRARSTIMAPAAAS